MDGHVADRDRIQVLPRQATTLHTVRLQLALRQAHILPHQGCRAGELQLANVDCTRPISDTQNKKGSSLRGNPSQWIETSVHSVPKGPSASERQTAHASHSNYQRVELFAVSAVVATAVFYKLPVP